MATSFATTFTGSSLNLSIPSIGMEFDVSASLLGWVVTGNILTVAAFSVPFGRLADGIGRKKIFIPGIFLFALTSLVAVFSNSMGFLVVIRFLQGIAGAMIYSTNTPFLINAFLPSQRGRVIGLNIAATYLGLSLGPVIGGFINHQIGWRFIFFIPFSFALFSLVIAWKALPTDKKLEHYLEAPKEQWDILGNLLYVATILATIYGFTMLSTSDSARYFLIVGLILFLFFVGWERKIKNPLIKVTLFTKNRGFAFSNVAALLNYGATFAVGYLIAIYLQVIMGYSSQTAGFIMISQPLIMMVVSPLAGRLSDRFSSYKLSSLGMGFCAFGIMFFALIKIDTSLTWIITGLIVTGLGFGLFSSPNTNAVMGSVADEDHGVASSILTTMRSVGHSSSMALVTIVMGVYMGDLPLSEANPETLMQAIHTIFFIGIFICILGVFFSLARKKE
jgi:EmrB/QacA subfamily drug resistance transporter